ncbi:MAG: hypothetical protein U5L00_17125 [Desulfovermiculus sp.]|nr:hypothetical protein [Desulfovermiculus sp.]
MDNLEKARIRMEHWIEHNDQHQQEYDAFARELEEAGKNEAAAEVRAMNELTAKGSEHLRQAIALLQK